MRSYGGHIGEADTFKRAPSYQDKDGSPYPCCGTGHVCAQHVTQRQLDLEWLGYWLSGRKIAAGLYAHMSAG